MRVFREGRELEAKELEEDQLEVLGSEVRRRILELLSGSESYPAEIAETLGLSKQRAYYHFDELRESGLLEQTRREEKSGGTAVFHVPLAESLVYDLGAEGRPSPLPEMTEGMREFLSPMLEGAEIDCTVVAGSSEPHGPDGVRARDGHLAGQLAGKLGRYGEIEKGAVKLDTELNSEEDFRDNLVILGGVLTNTVAKKFNDRFPASFAGDSFPYRKIETANSVYEEDSIGVVCRAGHPSADGMALYLVAGVRARGTRAAVRAFSDLEEITSGYGGGEFCRVVRGLDMDGDGRIDGYEVVE